MLLQPFGVVTFWGPVGVGLDTQSCVNLSIELPFGLESLLLSDLCCPVPLIQQRPIMTVGDLQDL